MLLREFRDPAQSKPRLWQLDKQTGAVVPQTTEAAASVRRLYALIGEDGERHDHLEAFFSLVEGHAAASLRRLHADSTVLAEGDRMNLSLLLALQDARTPAGHRRVLEQLDAMARAWTAAQLSDAEKSNRLYLRHHPDASWEDAEQERIRMLRDLRDGAIAVENPPETAFRTMMANWLGVSGQIADLRWKLLHSKGQQFFIGDRPMVMHDPTPKFPFSGNGLLSSPNAYTLMPLGPRLCLRMDQKGSPLEQRKAAKQVEGINLRSYGWAQRFVYGADRDGLIELHQRALHDPDSVPRPRADPQVICEPADPDDRDVGVDHPPGYPKGFWYEPPDEPPQFMAYRLQYRDDPRTVVIDDDMLKPQPRPRGWRTP